MDTIDFLYAYQRLKKTEIDGLKINIISLDDLILLKRAAVRERSKSRDSEDLAFLEKIKNKNKD